MYLYFFNKFNMLYNTGLKWPFFGTKFCTFHASELKTRKANHLKIFKHNKELYSNFEKISILANILHGIYHIKNSFLLRESAAHIERPIFLYLLITQASERPSVFSPVLLHSYYQFQERSHIKYFLYVQPR